MPLQKLIDVFMQSLNMVSLQNQGIQPSHSYKKQLPQRFVQAPRQAVLQWKLARGCAKHMSKSKVLKNGGFQPFSTFRCRFVDRQTYMEMNSQMDGQMLSQFTQLTYLSWHLVNLLKLVQLDTFVEFVGIVQSINFVE